MEFKNLTYFLLIIGSLIIPLILSFEKNIGYVSKLKYLFPAMLFTGAIFIIWDLRFEELGIWKFNKEYIIGKYILTLPVEEWLFFLVIPYSCVFIYEVFKYHFKRFEKPNLFLTVSLVLLVLFALLAYFYRQKLYTFFTFFLLTIYFGYTIFRNRFKKHYTKFYFAYVVSLLPFFIVNGLLTSLPVVEYNNAHNMGIRVTTIPVEDFAYLFLLLLMNITIYEYLKERRIY